VIEITSLWVQKCNFEVDEPSDTLLQVEGSLVHFTLKKKVKSGATAPPHRRRATPLTAHPPPSPRVRPPRRVSPPPPHRATPTPPCLPSPTSASHRPMQPPRACCQVSAWIIQRKEKRGRGKEKGKREEETHEGRAQEWDRL